MSDTLKRLDDALAKARDAISNATPGSSGASRKLAREWIELAIELAKQHREELRTRGINGAGSEGFGRL